MWFINNWYSQTIDFRTVILYAVLEEEIYTDIPEVILEVLEEHYMYEYIFTLIKSIHFLLEV